MALKVTVSFGLSFFLDFENFNDQTAEAGREIIVPYRQNYTMCVCVCVCVCVCGKCRDFNVKSRCCIRLLLGNHILQTKMFRFTTIVTGVGSHLLCNVRLTKYRSSVKQPPYYLPVT